MYKKILALFINLMIISSITALSVVPAIAQSDDTDAGATISIDPLGGGEYGSLTDTGLGETDPLTVAAQIVNVFLRILGALTVFFMVYAGWIWIWARGNADEIQRAKDIIRGSIIGLLVILSSFGVMQFVFYYLTKITNAVE
jgi:hypothetical protein